MSVDLQTFERDLLRGIEGLGQGADESNHSRTTGSGKQDRKSERSATGHGTWWIGQVLSGMVARKQEDHVARS
jgi:hypothetical protein